MVNEKETVVLDEQASTELITVVQLPIIKEQLQTVKSQIEAAVAEALAMKCTEENLQAVKKKRAELRKAFDDLEQRRKMAKDQVMAPYNAFESVYRECVTEVFTPGDKKLKEAIDNIENGIKQAKAAKAKAWFDEYAASLGIDFLTWEQVGLNVTKSVTLKKLNEQSKACLDRVHEELEMIQAQEHSDEILAEYKANGCNVSDAYLTVKNRLEAVERERQRREAAERERQRRAEAEAEKLAALEEAQQAAEEYLPEPEEIPVPEVLPVPEEEEIEPPVEASSDAVEYELHFTVWGTLGKLKALKQFLEEGGYRYE